MVEPLFSPPPLVAFELSRVHGILHWRDGEHQRERGVRQGAREDEGEGYAGEGSVLRRKGEEDRGKEEAGSGRAEHDDRGHCEIRLGGRRVWCAYQSGSLSMSFCVIVIYESRLLLLYTP